MEKFKPNINNDNVSNLLNKIYNHSAGEIEEVHSGKIKRVFFFKCKGKSYVIRFSENNIEFQIEKFIQENVKDQEFPIPRIYYLGKHYDLYYSITKRIKGTPLQQICNQELVKILPAIMESMVKFHSINISSTTGYGWLDDNLNGCFTSFKKYTEENFSNELAGFWYGWHELFDRSFFDSMECVFG